jgi:uracil-DNA glycosylase family protein
LTPFRHHFAGAALSFMVEEQGPEGRTIAQLRAEAADCRRCPLYRNATQTVFGEGASHAAIVFVGEQPGDQEDLQGKPFVGPAGKLFDRALAEAGIDRKETYITNAVKHFKFEPRGKKRLHKRPDLGEIEACRWWLRAEIAVIRPRLIVALGATAARSLAGRAITITKVRGKPLELMGHQGLVTVHPSYLLRVPDQTARRLEYRKFIADLRLADRYAHKAQAAA